MTKQLIRFATVVAVCVAIYASVREYTRVWLTVELIHTGVPLVKIKK
jgi:hypothetical protein